MPQKWQADAFEVRPSTIPNAGDGLFALVHISLEDTIGYYTGKVLATKLFTTQNDQLPTIFSISAIIISFWVKDP